MNGVRVGLVGWVSRQGTLRCLNPTSPGGGGGGSEEQIYLGEGERDGCERFMNGDGGGVSDEGKVGNIEQGIRSHGDQGGQMEMSYGADRNRSRDQKV